MSARVALDVMGGDAAPAATVAGAVRAARRWNVQVILVGRAAEIEPELARGGVDLPIVDAPDVVGMDEDPVAALRAKPEASVRVACQLVADGEAGAIVSAGSTGATLTAALLTLGRLPGVRRPVVAAVLPVAGRQVVLADAGGSMDVHAEAFAGYAAMGAAYAAVLGASQPTIALLNVGSEPGKGNALAKEAAAVLDGMDGFAGNIEPEGVMAGAADVVVTDGFTGNIFLKTVEAIGVSAGEEHDAAAILLGINGEVLIAHGAATPDDVALALRRGAQVATAGLAAQVGRRLTKEARF